MLQGEDGVRHVVHDYFAGDHRARLMSPEGASLSPDVVAALAGPLAPGQYAQAGNAAPAAAARVGVVAKADGNVTIVRNGVAITPHAGDAILKGDVLQTLTGDIGVTFNDGSTLNLTANSRMVVNEFVYDPNGHHNSQVLDLVQGSLTFISGQVAHHGHMQIGTPVATMGIRGTVGGVTNANDGSVRFYVSQSATGAVITDSHGTIIAHVTQSGPEIVVHPTGPLQVLAEEVQKSPQELAAELSALQHIISVQSVGQQILENLTQPNPNPQSGDHPHTQIPIDLNTHFGSNDSGDGITTTVDSGTVTIDTPNSDHTGTTTTVVTVPIPVNLAPLNFGPSQQTVDEDTALVFSNGHANALSVFDSDTTVLTVTLTAVHGVLTLSGIAGLAFAAGDGTGDAAMTFSGTQASINAALNGLSFLPDHDYNGHASVQVQASDGSLSATETVGITVNPVNDAPVVDAHGGSLAYTENDAATAIDTALTISDVDSATLHGATVQIASDHFHASEDVLGFADQNGITGDYNNGVLTLTGTASVADYQTALRSVTYYNSSDNPSSDTRTVSSRSTTVERSTTSESVTSTVTVNAVNDAPVVTAGGTLDYTENDAATAIDPALTASDVDSTTLWGDGADHRQLTSTARTCWASPTRPVSPVRSMPAPAR